MKNTVMVLALLAITFSIVTLSVVDFQNAEAAKASGTYTSKYGSATKNKVCGDQLCSDVSKQQPSVSITEFNSLLDRMDAVHEEHQSQMIQKWKSLSFEKQTEMLAHMSKKVEKMESMDIAEHMAHMDKMKHHDSDKSTKHHDSDKSTKHHDSDKSTKHHEKMIKKHSDPLYNETLNPRQVDYPNVLGFNDLHIHANRHLDVEKSHGSSDHLLQTIVHHHCKVYDDMTAACLLFPYGMTDQDKPYGVEYVITSVHYEELPEDEKKYWHYHKTEFPRAEATFPELTDEELTELLPILDETYGKVYYFWNYGDSYPLGEPYVLVVQDIPDH